MSAGSRALSIVIPVYGSAGTLDALYERVERVLTERGADWEVIFVDDGSADDSWSRVAALQRAHPSRVVAIRLSRNFGQHNALMCGFREARGEVLVTMDDDLQNPPEEIPKLLDALEGSDLDLVYGRYRTKAHGLWRNAGSWLINLFFRAVFDVRVTVTSFRAIRRSIVTAILPYDLNYTFVDGLLVWVTQRVGEVDVEHHPRGAGRSGYTLRRLVTLAFNLLTNFSLVPLQFVSALGLLLAGFGFVTGAYYLGLYFLDRITVPGYASTITAILVLGGTQLLALGMVGEYLGRLHLNVNKKPQYAVRERLADGE